MLFLFLVPIVSAAEDKNYGAYSSLDLKFTLDSEVVIQKIEAGYEVEYVKGEVSFYPRKDERQEVKKLDLISTGENGVNNKFASYYWGTPPAGTYEFGIDSLTRVNNYFYKVNKKIKFPLANLKDVLDFTEPTDNIDVNQEIEDQARDLIKGEDDLYVAVFNIAEWTRDNIEYNLTSLTAEVVQPSSWVLKNRQGVCDELTNLFISMLRSVGIPARFVSGMAYTNIDDAFGNHGWAEVYFPGVGWIPYDVTYGQYGWIDPSHLKLKEGKDSGAPSAEYSWRASGVELDLKDLRTETIVAELGQGVESPVEFTISSLKDNVGFGSFVPLEVNIKNKLDSYFVANIYVFKAPGLLGENSRRVLLKPREEKVTHFIISVPEDLDSGYIYTAGLGVSDAFGFEKETTLKYASTEKTYSKEQALAIVESYSRKDEKKVSNGIGLKCNFEKEFYHSNESAKLSCLVKNLSPKKDKFEVCHRLECLNAELDVGESENMNFFTDASSGGRLIVSAEASDGIKYEYINLNVIQLPEISIADFKPVKISYNELAEVSFMLKTKTSIKNIKIDTGYGSFDIPDFRRETNVKYSVPAKVLVEGAKLKISYEDEKGAKYVENLAFNVNVTEKPWYIRFKLWLKGWF